MLVSTFTPLILIAVMTLASLVAYEMTHLMSALLPIARDAFQGRITTQCMLAIYLVYYLAFGNALNMAFGVFYCVDVDPEGYVAGEQTVLW